MGEAVERSMAIVEKCLQDLDEMAIIRRSGQNFVTTTTIIMFQTLLTTLLSKGIDEVRDGLNQLEQQCVSRF